MDILINQILTHKEAAALPSLLESGGLPALISGLSAVLRANLAAALYRSLDLPLFAVCAVGSIFIWLPLLIITSRLKDKAWTQTVRYVMHLIFPLFWPFHICLERLLNFYRDLAADFRG